MADDSAAHAGVPTSSMEILEGGAGPASQATRAGLVLLYAPCYLDLPAAFLFDKPSLVIGREPPCDVLIPIGSVSRRHAQITHDGSHWVLTDAGSRNQTHIDGEPVGSIRLDPQQVIRIGDAFFKFVPAGAESYRKHRIDGARWGESPEDAAERATCPIVGGYQISRLIRLLDRAAPSSLPAGLFGESGVGKEVFARHIHTLSRRRGPFHAVNCAAISTSLIEAELFGSRKGAFTGADRDRPGHIRAANKGTLFLDEIGDMPLDAQGKLLRVLQEGEVVSVGSEVAERVDVRVVCATHRDLPAMVEEGRFRGDLLGRLNGFKIQIPKLRDRREDIFLLCRTLLARHYAPGREVTVSFMATLLHHDFRYNVRELEHAVRYALAMSRGAALDATHLHEDLRSATPTFGGRGSQPEAPAPAFGDSGAQETRRPPEAELRAMLERHRGNLSAVGREFSSSHTSVSRWLKHYGIRPDEYR